MLNYCARRAGEPTCLPLPASSPPFRSRLLAGFECGHLGWNGHDLLVTTKHVPEKRMAHHYALAAEHGLLAARDGLPWRHDPVPRLAVAEASELDVIWDLSHFDPPPDPIAHARTIALAAPRSRALWLCPINEPSLYPLLAGMAREEAVRIGTVMAAVARDHHPDVHILVNDPITGIGERQFAGLDALASSGPVDMIGINYYPHTARTSLSKVLLKTWKRYRKPIMVSETSWHDGHPVHHRRYPGFNKGAWLRYVLDEVTQAEQKGAEIVGVCWYPIIDSPPWNRPRARLRWSHGLIREDLSLDAALAEELQARRGRTWSPS